MPFLCWANFSSCSAICPNSSVRQDQRLHVVPLRVEVVEKRQSKRRGLPGACLGQTDKISVALQQKGNGLGLNVGGRLEPHLGDGLRAGRKARRVSNVFNAGRFKGQRSSTTGSLPRDLSLLLSTREQDGGRCLPREPQPPVAMNGRHPKRFARCTPCSWMSTRAVPSSRWTARRAGRRLQVSMSS